MSDPDVFWHRVNLFQLFCFTLLVAIVLLSLIYLLAAIAIVLTFPAMLVLTMLGMLFFMLLSTSEMWYELATKGPKQNDQQEDLTDCNYAGRGLVLIIQLFLSPFISIAAGAAITVFVIVLILAVAVPVPIMALWIVFEPWFAKVS